MPINELDLLLLNFVFYTHTNMEYFVLDCLEDNQEIARLRPRRRLRHCLNESINCQQQRNSHQWTHLAYHYSRRTYTDMRLHAHRPRATYNTVAKNNHNLSLQSGNVRLNVVLYRGSRERGLKTALEPYHDVGDVSKSFFLFYFLILRTLPYIFLNIFCFNPTMYYNLEK